MVISLLLLLTFFSAAFHIGHSCRVDAIDILSSLLCPAISVDDDDDDEVVSSIAAAVVYYFFYGWNAENENIQRIKEIKIKCKKQPFCLFAHAVSLCLAPFVTLPERNQRRRVDFINPE